MERQPCSVGGKVPCQGLCPWTRPEGAALWTPAKGLRPSRLPCGCASTYGIPCRGHGARRARRDAEPTAQGFAPASATVALWKPSPPPDGGEGNATDVIMWQGPFSKLSHTAANPRRGAPVARRDPRKGTYPSRNTRMGVERAEGPSRGPGAAPLAGSKGRALGGVQG